MNKKGFTLVELLATIIIIAVVAGITIPVALGTINKSKKKQEELLVSNIKNAVISFVSECAVNRQSFCGEISEGGGANKIVSLSQLVEYGYLSSSKTGDGNGFVVENPYNKVRGYDIDVSDCQIYIYDNSEYGFCGVANGSSSGICLDMNDKCKFLEVEEDTESDNPVTDKPTGAMTKEKRVDSDYK